MTLRSALYRWARLLGDVRGLQRGPDAMLRRLARRALGRAMGRAMNTPIPPKR